MFILVDDSVLVKLTFRNRTGFLFTEPPFNKILLSDACIPVFNGALIGGISSRYYPAVVFADNLEQHQTQVPFLKTGKILDFSPPTYSSSPNKLQLLFLMYYSFDDIYKLIQSPVELVFTTQNNEKHKMVISNKMEANLYDCNLMTPLTKAIQKVERLFLLFVLIFFYREFLRM